jgi:hypothetical protein
MKLLRCCIDENKTDDEDIDVTEVKSSIFSESISNDEDQSGPW